ncbi:MAG TPA: ABC transporter permease [Thermoanaerobaculia bacterium]|nr:ABC transporter permease [Thermoanaerobaculia bacterium]
MEIFLQDVRYALRGLRRSPGFAAAAVVTLALGMGATTAIFSVIRTVLLAPLPYAEPERRVMIWSRWKDFDKTWVADGEVMDYRRFVPSLESVAAWDTEEANLTGGGGEPVRVGTAAITANTFETLGAKPLLGRGLTEEEDRPGGAPVAVLAYGLWQNRFGGDPSVLGAAIEVDGVARRVVGVMPRGFALPTDFTVAAAEPSQIWIPVQFDPAQLSHGSHGYYAAGLLRRGATARRATAELQVVTGNLTRQGLYPAEMHFSAFAEPVDEDIRGGARRALRLVFAAVLFLLLMACANVANLLLARAEGRQREISVRAAIGAGKARLTQQLLTESLVLAVAGGVLGLALAWAGVRWIAAHGAAGLPALSPLGVEPRMLAFAAVLSVLTTLVFGFAPVVQSLRLDLAGSLKETASSTSGGLRRQGLRGALAAVQMGLAVVLLLGAGLMLRSLAALLRVDLGFEPRHVLTLQVRPPEATYPKPEAVVALYRALLERVRALPGVRAAGIVRSLPLAAEIGDWGIVAEGYDPPPGLHAKGDWQVVSDGALEALGERLLRGRPLAASDTADALPVVLVNETLARTYWPGQDPIGKHLRMGLRENDRPWMQVVGLLRDERHNGVTAVIKEKFYVPYAQFPRARGGDAARGMTIVVRADGDPMALVGPVRAEVRRLDPSLPVANTRLMTDVVDASLATPRLTGTLLAIFAGLALLLAGVGVAGVLSYLVSRRRREIGIRLALGSSRAAVLGLVVRRGVAYASMGIAAGMLAAFFLSEALAGLLFGVAPRDPITFASVAAILLAIAAGASAIPAWSAARVDPLEALRGE